MKTSKNEIKIRLFIIFFTMLTIFSLMLEYYGVYVKDSFTIWNGCLLGLTNLTIVLYFLLK